MMQPTSEAREPETALRGTMVVSGGAHPELARRIAEELGLPQAGVRAERFPDGEIRLSVAEAVTGRDLVIVQPVGPPVNENLVELLLLIDACRRMGAHHLTAVVPYVGYARQDRREPGEPLSSRLVGDMLRAADVDRVIAVDPHTPALEAALGVPTEYVSAVPVLAAAARRAEPGDAVVVSPDLGAVGLAERYGDQLKLPTAFVRKHRLSGTEVEVAQITGGVAERVPVIVDDMISTGGTVAAAARELLDQDAKARLIIVATHGLFAGSAVERLATLPIDRVIVSDTLPQRSDLPFALEVVPVAPLLADAVRRVSGQPASAGRSTSERSSRTKSARRP